MAGGAVGRGGGSSTLSLQATPEQGEPFSLGGSAWVHYLRQNQDGKKEVH